MYHIGIDIGSTYTKYCIMDSDREPAVLFSEKTPVRQKEHFAVRLEGLRNRYPDSTVTSCGYGRDNVDAVKKVNELTALAQGAYSMMGAGCVVLDIGGQDTKAICQEGGKLKRFYLNEKCAAGCGMFLQNTLHLFGMELDEIDLSGIMQPETALSSVCAVFAQSEIVRLLAKGCSEMAIIHAVIGQILQQAGMLLGKLDHEEVVLSGGLSRIKGIGEYAERVLGNKVIILPDAAYLSAIGCARLCE